MRHPDDNIDQRYALYQKKPGSINAAIQNFNRITEKSYTTFKEIMEDHADIGKAAIVIIARNYASHLVELACDESKTRAQRVNDIAGAIAPMYELMYDRLTKETIEQMVNSIEMKDVSGEESDA